MTSWFAKAKPSPDPDEGPLAALDAELRASAPKMEVPPALHRSIMRAVEAAAAPAPGATRLLFLRWLSLPAAAALSLLIVWLSVRYASYPAPEGPEPLAAAANALKVSGSVVQVPVVVIGPLSNELEGLNQDLNNAAQHLLASLP